MFPDKVKKIKEEEVVNRKVNEKKGHKSPIEEEALQAAKEVMKAFLIVYKVYSLYPEENDQCKRSLLSAMKRLQAYFKFSQRFRLEILKYELHLEGQPVYEGPEEEGNFAFVFFRDGIQWLEISSGIALDELHSLFRIVVSEQVRKAEKGDIVTALWETQLPHVDYYATDELLFAQQEDLSTEGIMDRIVEYSDKGFPGVDPDTTKDKAPQLSLKIQDKGDLFNLSEAEKEYLSSLMQRETTRDPMDDTMIMLLDALPEDDLQGDFEAIIDFLEKLYLDSLVRSDLERANELLKRMQLIEVHCTKEKKWALPVVERFFAKTVSSQAFKIIEENLVHLEEEPLNKLLHLIGLKAQLVEPLFRILQQTESFKLREVLIKVLAELGRKDFSMVASLLDGNEEAPSKDMILLLDRIGGVEACGVLEGFLQSPNPLIKKSALAVLMRQESPDFKKIFEFIEEEDRSIRKALFQCLGRQRNKICEDLLVDYIQEEDFLKKGPDQILITLKTLGRCGSTRSLPLLKKLLLRKGIFLPRDYHTVRHGATLALKDLGTPESLSLLEEGRGSKKRSIRKACVAALAEEKS
ncbi:MAG: hypothetical protein AMJ92_03005 [candidate division Zixibacteria bacterium SM23_81]|nr:MAG: hypothetical protein AMJ92_03005 [candidate division Zixibacteria bacterium SM23_81]